MPTEKVILCAGRTIFWDPTQPVNAELLALNPHDNNSCLRQGEIREFELTPKTAAALKGGKQGEFIMRATRDNLANCGFPLAQLKNYTDEHFEGVTDATPLPLFKVPGATAAAESDAAILAAALAQETLNEKDAQLADALKQLEAANAEKAELAERNAKVEAHNAELLKAKTAPAAPAAAPVKPVEPNKDKP